MENTLGIKKYSYICDKGPFLDINEDDIEIDLKNELFIVIDGFGGSNIGSETSKKIKETITHSYSRITGDPESNCTGILITLDTIESIVEEAVKKKCNFIVSFHPIIFSSLNLLVFYHNILSEIGVLLAFLRFILI